MNEIKLGTRYKCHIEEHGEVWDFEFTPDTHLKSGAFAGGYDGVDHTTYGEDVPAIVLPNEFVEEA